MLLTYFYCHKKNHYKKRKALNFTFVTSFPHKLSNNTTHKQYLDNI